MKLKKLASLALAGALTLGLLPALSAPALAADGDSTYTLTIPSELTVSGSGWNATGGISATGELASGKKLTVTATSTNGWKLVSGSNNVGYTLTTASGGNQTTSWEFTTLDGTAQGLGIIVEDYSSKPAGTYTDTVTFTASVASALTYIEVAKQYNRSIYMDNVRFYYIPGETYRQAVQNHGKENGTNWNIYSGNNNTTIYWGYSSGDLYINGKNNFATGSSQYCGFTLDSVVDPNQTYTHEIYND